MLSIGTIALPRLCPRSNDRAGLGRNAKFRIALYPIYSRNINVLYNEAAKRGCITKIELLEGPNSL